MTVLTRFLPSLSAGVYRPDLLAKYGPEVALHMGRDLDVAPDPVLLEDESSWFQRQEQEIAAM